MHIGLIGGSGPAAQDYYTRQLIGHFSHAGVRLDLTTAHGDAPTLLANLAADRRAQQAAIFVCLTERLARAGAEFVAVTSIAGHFCRAEFAAASPLPVIDMIDVVARDVAARGTRRAEAGHSGHKNRHGVRLLWRHHHRAGFRPDRS
jgi:aspartate racemase